MAPKAQTPRLCSSNVQPESTSGSSLLLLPDWACGSSYFDNASPAPDSFLKASNLNSCKRYVKFELQDSAMCFTRIKAMTRVAPLSFLTWPILIINGYEND